MLPPPVCETPPRSLSPHSGSPRGRIRPRTALASTGGEKKLGEGGRMKGEVRGPGSPRKVHRGSPLGLSSPIGLLLPSPHRPDVPSVGHRNILLPPQLPLPAGPRLRRCPPLGAQALHCQCPARSAYGRRPFKKPVLTSLPWGPVPFTTTAFTANGTPTAPLSTPGGAWALCHHWGIPGLRIRCWPPVKFRPGWGPRNVFCCRSG
ncbi:hypothetical protein NDU88_008274 [Pleurodeles waltl]|uniref:Uncharacterized protein n=1 Tax=Pleurodeles waltl TaxID=8319 RepID=A0AAV7VW47_PLEWA|nr:hypothetical protein NDU88_008274 [Pleurodeles waltl]